MLVYIKNSTYIYAAILLFIIPLPWLTAWAVAAIIHELSHIISVRLCGGHVDRLIISVGGVDMRCSSISDAKRVICTASGPIGGLLPVAFHHIFPRVAICAWLLSAYNLMPILPLDGGHILQILMSDSVLFYRIQTVLIVLCFLLGVYAAVIMGFGMIPLIIAFILLIKHRKTPCKKGLRRVQ